MIKRLFDIFLSLFGLIILFPVFGLIAVAIKLTSKGPVFYRGKRVGKGGKIFKIYKFRTMVENAEQIGGPSTAGDDPRLTKVGKFIKKFKIDELSQLINVLKGEMSFVGPRPEVSFYVDMMTKEEKDTILSIKPGITDWASLWNFNEEEVLRGSSDPEKTYQEEIRPEKIRLQMKYVKERNMLTDIKIIIQTVLGIFK